MKKISFIDFGREDFLRDEDGEVVKVKVSSYIEAENWLLDFGYEYGWTYQGVKYFNWNE